MLNGEICHSPTSILIGAHIGGALTSYADATKESTAIFNTRITTQSLHKSITPSTTDLLFDIIILNSKLPTNISMSLGKKVTLNSGHEIAQLGYGTWQSSPGEVSIGVYEALKAGYKHIDLAKV